MDPFRARLSGGLFLHKPDLLRQVENRDFHVRIVADALERPFTGIAAYIQQISDRTVEYYLQSLLERIVGIEMIEGEPACPGRFRKGRKPFVNRVPVSQALQPGRTMLPE